MKFHDSSPGLPLRCLQKFSAASTALQRQEAREGAITVRHQGRKADLGETIRNHGKTSENMGKWNLTIENMSIYSSNCSKVWTSHTVLAPWNMIEPWEITRFQHEIRGKLLFHALEHGTMGFTNEHLWQSRRSACKLAENQKGGRSFFISSMAAGLPKVLPESGHDPWHGFKWAKVGKHWENKHGMWWLIQVDTGWYTKEDSHGQTKSTATAALFCSSPVAPSISRLRFSPKSCLRGSWILAFDGIGRRRSCAGSLAEFL